MSLFFRASVLVTNCRSTMAGTILLTSIFYSLLLPGKSELITWRKILTKTGMQDCRQIIIVNDVCVERRLDQKSLFLLILIEMIVILLKRIRKLKSWFLQKNSAFNLISFKNQLHKIGKRLRGVWLQQQSIVSLW